MTGVHRNTLFYCLFAILRREEGTSQAVMQLFQPF
jgi:hypothetical protein